MVCSIRPNLEMRSTHRKKVRITKAKNNNVNMNNVKFPAMPYSRSLATVANTINKGPYKKQKEHFRNIPNNEFKRVAYHCRKC
jgi:hypothetical protein